MKWFKHVVDAHRGTSIQTLFDELGHFGPCSYWIIVEMCSEKWFYDAASDEKVFAGEFRFHTRILREKLRGSWTKVELMLNLGSTLDLFSYQISNNIVQISFPKLLKLLDRREKYRRKHVAECDAVGSLDKDKDKDKDIHLRESVDSRSRSSAPAKLHQLIEIWNLGCKDLPKVVKSNASRDKKIAARFNEHTLEEWSEIIERIAESDFCNARTGGTWRATFDWVLKPDTGLRVLEGQYDNREPEKIQTKQNKFIKDEWHEKALLVIEALKIRGWADHVDEVKAVLGDDLYRLAVVNASKMRQLPGGDWYVRNIIGLLKEANQIINQEKLYEG